ncbi:hypothetical protein HID58_066639, partial [Brassica napus]
PRRVKAYSEHSSSRRRLRRSRDRGTVTEIVDRLRVSRKQPRTLELQTEISKIQRSRNSYGDRGMVASITEAARYKKRSTHKERTH